MKFSKYASRRDKIRQLRSRLVLDSIERSEEMKLLLSLVREEEREKTLASLEGVRDRAEAERARS